MRSDFLPFSRPSISEEDITAVVEVLRSGWLTTGPKAAEFEQAFCEYTGCRGAVALSSATAGMHLVLEALGIGPGDEVITTSMTWVSTVNLIVLAGATPVFVDVDRDTLLVSPESIKASLTDSTKLIIPVHFAGAPVDLEPIRKLAADKNVFLVEDAAHALGTQYKGQRIGCIGDSIFSFHPIKNITTGEGGMFCSDDPELADCIRRLKFHGLGVDACPLFLESVLNVGSTFPSAGHLQTNLFALLFELFFSICCSLNRALDFELFSPSLAGLTTLIFSLVDLVIGSFHPCGGTNLITSPLLIIYGGSI